MADDFLNLRGALARFDRYHARWQREFERMLDKQPNCKADDPKDPQWELNGAAVHKAFENLGRYRVLVLAPAFHADTSDRNSRQTCEMVFRYEPLSGWTDVPNWVRDLAYGKKVAA